jgi:Uma2 family endonuclease
LTNVAYHGEAQEAAERGGPPKMIQQLPDVRVKERKRVVNLPASSDLPQRLVLQDVSWEMYEEFFTVFDEQPFRTTYDRGTLEIMAISHRHDWVKGLTARMIERMAEELNVNIKTAGSTSQKRRLVERALEPDESYYLASEPLVRFKEELDFERDPPPDLALEVDITSSCLDRMSIYAAIKVPELWRYDHVNDEMLFYFLDDDGSYRQTDRSQSFPLLTSDVLNRFLRMRHSQSESEVIRAFIDWVREASSKSPKNGPSRQRKKPRKRGGHSR